MNACMHALASEKRNKTYSAYTSREMTIKFANEANQANCCFRAAEIKFEL